MHFYSNYSIWSREIAKELSYVKNYAFAKILRIRLISFGIWSHTAKDIEVPGITEFKIGQSWNAYYYLVLS